MIYIETDFVLALGKEGDWLKERAESYSRGFRGQLTTSIVTFIELFLLAERYRLDRTRLAAETLELLSIDFDESIVFQADELIGQGFSVFDAFHAAHALLGGHRILSSDKVFDKLAVERLRLEPEDEPQA